MSTSPFAPISGFPKTDLNAVNSPAFKLDDDKKEGKESFTNVFASFLQNANDAQNTAGEYTKKLALGQMSNTHDMAIAGAKSEIMLHMVTQITSKLSSMTTTLFQMQI